jgi:hypothetical protein
MTNYGVIVSPGTRKILRSTPSFPGGSITTWAEIRGAQSSPEVTDNRAFCGCWNNLTFCLWDRSVELLVDAVTMALTGQIKIYANLLADVGVRYPGAFLVTATGHIVLIVFVLVELIGSVVGIEKRRPGDWPPPVGSCAGRMTREASSRVIASRC